LLSNAGRDGCHVRGIQRVEALVPILPAEGNDRQIQFHLVVELAIASEYLDLALARRIPGDPDAGSNLVSPTEADGMSNSARWLVFGR